MDTDEVTLEFLTDIEEARKALPLGAEPRMSCLNSIKILNFFESVHHVDTAQILRHIGKDRDFCTNPANWLSNYETFWLYYGCHCAVTGFTHRDWTAVGSALDTTAPGYIRAIARLMPVRNVYQRVPWYAQRLSCYSRYTTLAVTGRSARYRFEILEPKVRSLYSMGGECRWHQGALQAIPRMHSASLPPADVRHDVCAMPLGHLFTVSYHVPAARFAYTTDGFHFDGNLVARWVTLRGDETGPEKYGSFCTAAGADALMVTTDINTNGRTLFYEGEIYDAPHCEFDVTYKGSSRLFSTLFAKMFNLADPFEEQVQLIQEKYFEVDRARRALATANVTIDRYSKNLESLVRQRTADLESANRRLKEEIDTRSMTERQLTDSLAHKEALLKEIHHRVKNNLQIVTSLLDMTTRRTKDQKALAVLDGAKNKIQTMALIHSHLYMSPDLNHVDIRQHVIELVGNLRLIYDPAMQIDIRLNIAEVWLPLRYAMPCSLILNELLTNGFKHAFSNHDKGWLQVFIRTPSKRTMSITVSDNGTGLKGEAIPGTADTLGLTLVQALVKNQLHSALDYRFNHGAVFEFSFDMEEEEPWRVGF